MLLANRLAGWRQTATRAEIVLAADKQLRASAHPRVCLSVRVSAARARGSVCVRLSVCCEMCRYARHKRREIYLHASIVSVISEINMTEIKCRRVLITRLHSDSSAGRLLAEGLCSRAVFVCTAAC